MVQFSPTKMHQFCRKGHLKCCLLQTRAVEPFGRIEQLFALHCFLLSSFSFNEVSSTESLGGNISKLKRLNGEKTNAPAFRVFGIGILTACLSLLLYIWWFIIFMVSDIYFLLTLWFCTTLYGPICCFSTIESMII